VADKRAGIVLEAKNATAPAFRQVKQEFNLLRAAGKQVGNVFTGIGQGIGQRFAGVAFDAINTVTSAFTQAIPNALAYARSIDEISDATGATAEQSSILAGTLSLLGIPTDGLASTFRTLSSEIVTNEKKFAALGIEIRGQNGQLLDTVTVLNNARSRFVQMGEGAVKTALAVDLFGKSALSLIDFLKLSDEAADNAASELERMGLVLSETTTTAADDADRSFALLGLTVKGIQVQFASELLPAIINIINAIRNLVMENREGLIRVLTTVTATLAGFISGVLGANNAISGFINSLRASTAATNLSRAGLEALIAQKKAERIAYQNSGSAASSSAGSTQKATDAINRQITRLRAQRNALRDVISEQARQAEAQFTALLSGMDAAERSYQVDQRRADLANRLAESEKEAADSRIEAQREINRLRGERQLALAAESDADRQFQIAVDYAEREQDLIQRYADEATRLDKAIADARAEIAQFELEIKRQAAIDEQRAKIEAAQTTFQEIQRLATEDDNFKANINQLQAMRDDLFRQQQVAAEQGNADLVKAIAINLAAVESAIAAQQEAKEITRQERKLERERQRAATAVSTSNTVIATMDAEIAKLEEELAAYKDVAENGLSPLVNLQELLAQRKDATSDAFAIFQKGFADAAASGERLAAAIKSIADGLDRLARSPLGNLVGFFFGGSTFGVSQQDLVKRLKTRADGGPVSGNTPYIVGERGPELFVPAQSGNIVPNNGMGGQVNVTVQAGAFLGSSDDAREFARRIYGALNDEAKRRGTVLGGAR
jgi:hypothetical protein